MEERQKSRRPRAEREEGRGRGGERKEKKNEKEQEKKMLTKPKIPAGQRWFTIRIFSTVPECQNWRVLLGVFFLVPPPPFPPIPKVNVLTYLEEELSALCKATFTEELLLKSWACRLGAVWSLAGARQVQKGAEVGQGGDGERAWCAQAGESFPSQVGTAGSGQRRACGACMVLSVVSPGSPQLMGKSPIPPPGHFQGNE